MSIRVLVIPEDPSNNGYILKPLVDAMLAGRRVGVYAVPRGVRIIG